MGAIEALESNDELCDGVVELGAQAEARAQTVVVGVGLVVVQVVA